MEKKKGGEQEKTVKDPAHSYNASSENMPLHFFTLL